MLCENFTFTQILKKFSAFKDSTGSLLASQKPTIEPCPEQLNVLSTFTFCFSNISVNIFKCICSYFVVFQPILRAFIYFMAPCVLHTSSSI